MAPEAHANLQYDPFLADVYSAGVILYLLLTGSHAYETPTLRDPRFASIWAGKHGLEHLLKALNVVPGVGISHEAVDLLAHIMCPQDKRWSIEQILAHPWLRSSTPRTTPVAAAAAVKTSAPMPIDKAVETKAVKSEAVPMDTSVTPKTEPAARFTFPAAAASSPLVAMSAPPKPVKPSMAGVRAQVSVNKGALTQVDHDINMLEKQQQQTTLIAAAAAAQNYVQAAAFAARANAQPRNAMVAVSG